MTKAPAGMRRLSKFAMGRSLLVFLGLALLAAACTGQHGDGSDDHMELRQEAMAEAVKVFSNYDTATGDPQALKLAVAMVNGAMVPLRPIFKAISKMPETTPAEVGAKEQARAAANELLSRHLAQLLPGGSVKVTDADL